MKALVAERDTSCREGICDALRRWGWEVVATPLDLTALQSGLEGAEVAILGSLEGDGGTVSACRHLRELAGGSPLYLIALVTSAQEAVLREVVDAGADECLLMPLQPGELWVRLRTAARVVGLQEELVQARLDLQTQTTRDSLTGLLNRGAIFDVLAGEVARCRREGTGFAVAVADIDHFKWVNDQYGHQAGDTVLAGVAERMLQAVRPYDSVGRYGGEEFLIVLPGCDGPTASEVAERLRALIAAESFGPRGITTTVSVGVAFCASEDAADGHDLIWRADAAMYRAKRAGRNRVLCFHAGPSGEEEGWRGWPLVGASAWGRSS